MNESQPQLSSEALLERHRNEKKELNAKITSLRHSITKGDKKAKKEVNAQIESLQLSLKLKHENELKLFPTNCDSNKSVNQLTHFISNISIDNNRNDLINSSVISEDITSKGIKYNETKPSKAQRRRDAKALKDKERQQRIDSQVVDDCDNPRIIEAEKLNNILDKRQLALHEIASDGDCLYKAVEHQLSLKGIQTNVQELRLKTCDYMKAKREEFLPFLTSDKTGDLMNDEEYDEYCNQIAYTKSWGGQLELRVISHLFKTSIEVIQAEGTNVLIGNLEYKFSEPLILSYHRHAYQLGEHYNSVTKMM